MTTIPVSAVLITRDAEAHLERVLAAVARCDDLVVLDSGSSDRTREIVLAAGGRFLEHPFEGYGPQKRRAVELARHDWVLAVDADEVLDSVAQQAVAEIDWATADPAACWRVRRRPFVGRREIRHGHWVPDRVLRIFNRRCHTFSADPVHESVRSTGPVLDLDGSLLHFSYPDLAAVFRPELHRLKAERYRRQGRRAGAVLLAARASGVFLRSLVLRRGFLDGPAGVVVALAGAVGAVVGLALASDAAAAGSSPASAMIPRARPGCPGAQEENDG